MMTWGEGEIDWKSYRVDDVIPIAASRYRQEICQYQRTENIWGILMHTLVHLMQVLHSYNF